MYEDNKITQVLKYNFFKTPYTFLAAFFLILVIAIIIFQPFTFSPNYPTSETNFLLKHALSSEQDAIESAFNTRFAFLADSYTIKKTVLVSDSRHAAILLTLDQTPYRALLEKEKGTDQWVVKTLPFAVLSYEEYPDIPQKLLRTINNLKFQEDQNE